MTGSCSRRGRRCGGICLGWEVEEAGDDQALADFLIDVLIVSDPTDPRVESLRGQGEKDIGWMGVARFRV